MAVGGGQSSALATEGDDRGWDFMVAVMSEILSRKTISATRWNELIKAVQYLARHADQGSARAVQLITLRRPLGQTRQPPQINTKRGHPTYTHTSQPPG